MNKLRITLRINAVTALLCLLTICGCSIFDLKNPAPPDVGVKTEDPLNIGDILEVSRPSSADMDYSDYFVNGVVFEYTHFQKITGRGELINMLNRLRTQTSLVEWQPEKADKRFDGNLQIVENMPYTVYSGGRVICAGRADFHIVRESDWMISYWKDVPDGGYTPFFEP
jgi:hypothetical protein